jgi:hypothetical protein
MVVPGTNAKVIPNTNRRKSGAGRNKSDFYVKRGLGKRMDRDRNVRLETEVRLRDTYFINITRLNTFGVPQVRLTR